MAAYALRKCGFLDDYQPLDDTDGRRSCQNRWDAIQTHLPETGMAIDLGCNTGFFTHAMAKRGLFSIGFESELKNIIVAHTAYDLPNLIFKHFDLNDATVMQLPQAEVVLFLSVFHHLVKNHGQLYAENILQNLARICRSNFYFETGQPNETGTKFCDQMAFMADVNAWVETFFLERCGFARVVCLGEFETFLTPVPRKLFLALRQP